MKKLLVLFTVIALVMVTMPARAVNISNDLGMYFYSKNIPVTQGNYYFVCSAGSSDGAGSDSYEGTNPRQPLATIDAAINKCTGASTTYPGDVIVVMPHHTEIIAAATTLVPDTAGIYIIGLGEGVNRPKLTFSATASSILISGAGTTFDNFIFENTIDDVSECIDVGADDVTIKNCEFRDAAGTSGKIFVMLDGANTADRFKCYDSIFTHISGTENGDCSIEIDDAQDGVEIVRCRFYGDCDEAPIISDAVCTNMFLNNLYVENTVASGYAIELTGACTGFMDNILAYTDDAKTAIDPGSLKHGSNVMFSPGADRVPVPIPFAIGNTFGAGPYIATCSTTSTTSIVDVDFGNFPDDYFTGWSALVVWDAGGAAAAPQGEQTTVTDFEPTTGTFTVTAITSMGAGDKVLLYTNPLRQAISAKNAPVADSLSNILHKGTGYSFDAASDSLEAISEAVATLSASTGLPYYLVTATGGDTTSIISTGFTGYGNDYFNTGWVATCIFNDGAGTAPEGETRDISDYLTTGDLTVSPAFSGAVGENDVFFVYYDPLRAVCSDTSDAVNMSPEIPDDSILANILAIDGDVQDYDRRYDSLEALGDDTDTIISTFTADGLDHLVLTADGSGAYPASVQNDTILAMLMSDDDPAAVSSYNNTTDSLEAISVALEAGAGCTTAIEADNLDHLGAAACADTEDAVDMTAEVADNSILANILDDAGDTSAYDRRYSSLYTIATLAAGAGISYHRPNEDTRYGYFTVTADCGTATWQTQTTHEIVTVTGSCRVRILAICTQDLTGEGATIELGTANNTAEIIAQTTGTDLDAADIWESASPSVECIAYSSAVKDIVVIQGTDIGYTVGTAALTDGTIIFHIWWEPLDATGDCSAGAGGPL